MKVYISPYLKYHKEGQHVDVTIDEYDTWSLDRTLAHIIHPALIQLKEQTHGAPRVDNNDVPIDIRGNYNDPWDQDEHWFERWDWVLDEMIWAFAAILKGDFDEDFDEEHYDRVTNGLRLFGKYYRGLWT